MRTISLEHMDPQFALDDVVRTLKGSGLVAYPTETFYALGVRFDIGQSLSRLYEVKGRSEQKAVPLIISGPEMLEQVTTQVSGHARRLIEKYWPGPLTLLLPAPSHLPTYVSIEDKVAVRQPGQSFALELARAAGFPITSTSANHAGQPPARDARTVMEYFPRELDLLVDGGETPGGLPSTIIDLAGDVPVIVRKGACKLTPEDLAP
jgi:L-threonylcarbamoyladenylate synthase